MPLILIVNLAGKIAAILVARAAPSTALALWILPDTLFLYHLLAPNAQGFVRLHRRFATTQLAVWLTLDDGPDPEDTPRILALLAEHGARATFFVIGERAAAHPQLVRDIVAAGHEVAHHTHTHPLATFWFASRARVARELDEGLAVLAHVGVTPTRFRPPVGQKNVWLAAALRERGLIGVGWSARGLELWPGGAPAVAARVTRGLAPGSILLVHEGPPVPRATRVEGIRLVLERLRERGYRCVVPTAAQLSG